MTRPQATELAGLDQRQRHAEIVAHEIDIAGEQILQGRCGAAIGHVLDLHLPISCSISDVRCEVVPLPWVADVTLPGLAFRYAMNSGTVR